MEIQTRLKSAVETVQLKDENFKNLSILKKSEINSTLHNSNNAGSAGDPADFIQKLSMVFKVGHLRS